MTSNALERLVKKTSTINDTCANLKDCIKCNKCKFEEPIETCDDYQLVMSIKQDLDWKTWCVDVWGYKSISELETRLESYSLTLMYINEFVKWLKEEFRKNENLVNSKNGRFSNIVELALLNDILDKLKELGLYKEEE